MAKETQSYTPERTVSAIFKQQEQVDAVVRRLLDRNVPRDYISVMGRDFQSQTRISGFVTKKDVILGGLRTGAIFGSLFGSLFSLLTGVGVLFIPFIGSVVSAGPLGAVLLGAASGALAGSAGAGLVSVFVALGMPEEKAAIYQTRLEAGEFVVLAEVPAEQVGEFQMLLESAGGEEMHTGDRPLPRACEGECNSPEDLAPEVRAHLSEPAQQAFIRHYNRELKSSADEVSAERAAWGAIEREYEEDENGVWSKQKVTA